MGLHETMNNKEQQQQTDELRITQLLVINSEQAEQIKKLTISLNELQKEKQESENKLSLQLNGNKSDYKKLQEQNNRLQNQVNELEQKMTTIRKGGQDRVSALEEQTERLEKIIKKWKKSYNQAEKSFNFCLFTFFLSTVLNFICVKNGFLPRIYKTIIEFFIKTPSNEGLWLLFFVLNIVVAVAVCFLVVKIKNFFNNPLDNYL